MKIKYDDYFNNGVSWQTRATVWCLASDLVDNGDDTYGLVDGDVAKTLGFGSEIIVIDKAGMFLFWNGEDKAYDWGKYDGSNEPPAGYVTVAPKQSVTITDSEVVHVQLTTVEGFEVPSRTPSDWIVVADDNTLLFSDEYSEYMYTDSENTWFCDILAGMGGDPNAIVFCVYNTTSEETIPGTYTVAIYAPESEGQ